MAEPSRRSLDLAIVGNLAMDVIFRGVTDLPDWGREVLGTERGEYVAGQAGYLAQASTRLGLSTAVVSVAGADSAGANLLEGLRSAGVRIDGVHQVSGRRTGLTVAVVRRDGERAFISELSSSVALDADYVEQRWHLIERARVIALVGLFNLPGLDLAAAARILLRAREHGVTTLLDTGWDPHGWSAATVRSVYDMLEHTDIFLPNRDEVTALTGETEAVAAQGRLQAVCAGSVIVKDGPQGSVASVGSRSVRVPAVCTHVVDTVGAGDVYNAGFLAGYLPARDVESGMRLGTAAAACYIGRTRDRFPSSADVTEAANRITTSAEESRRLSD